MRNYIVILTIVALVAMSGCIGVESFTSSQPAVEQNTLDETGFEEAGNSTIKINESREILGSERGAKITSHISSYQQPATEADIDFDRRSIEDLNVSRLLELTGTEPSDYITAEDLANETDASEQEVQLAIESNDGDIQSVAEELEIELEELVDKDRIIEQVDEEEIERQINDQPDRRGTPGAVYTAVSTPSAGILGTELNPLVQAPTDEVIDIAKGEFDDGSIEIKNRTDTYNLEDQNGNVFSVDKYNVTITTQDGDDIDGKLLISTRTDSESGDVLLLAGIYPNLVDSQSDIDDMMRSTTTESEEN